MLAYKSWLETRWPFLIGLAVTTCFAAGIVLGYQRMLLLLEQIPEATAEGLGKQVQEAAALMRDYRFYIWSEWYGKSFAQLWCLWAVILGTGGLLSEVSKGAAIFTLSLPVSRNRIMAIRAATGLGELLILSVIPSLLVPLLSPAIGQSYALGSALVHSACLFLAGTVMFSLTFLLSTIYPDVWRPALLAIGAVILLAVAEQLSPELRRFSLIRIMGAENYFRNGTLPWTGLLVSVTASAAMLYGAAMNIARRDY